MANTQIQQLATPMTSRNAPIPASSNNRPHLQQPGSTLRPRSPGYINPEHIAHILRDLPEPTKTLFSRGMISEEVALEQWRNSMTGRTQTSEGPRSMGNQGQNSWVLQDIAERRKAADREARAAATSLGQNSTGPGAFSFASPGNWTSPESVERIRHPPPMEPASPRQWTSQQSMQHVTHSSPYLGGAHGVPWESNRHRKVWVNPEYSERDNWARIEANLTKSDMIKSPFVPSNYGEHIQHRAVTAEAAIQDETRKINIKKAEKERLPVPIKPAMMGKVFNDNRGLVTSMETIWSPSWKPTTTHPQARWPTQAEMKEEGDERYTSGFDRFLPLPRVPGNETVGHKMRTLLVPYQMDVVRELPTPAYENDIPEPVDENEQRYWLGDDLFEHIEKYGDDPEPELKGKEREI